VNLIGLLTGDQATLPERMLFFQWHRGDCPELGRACAVRGPRFKLVQAAGRGEQSDYTPHWALYDLVDDSGEQLDLSAKHGDLVERMKDAYYDWFNDVSATRGFPAARAIVGTMRQNPVTLTRQDWRGNQAGWNNASLGYWEIEVDEAASYEVSVRMPAVAAPRSVQLRIGAVQREQPWPPDADRISFAPIRLERGPARVEATVVHDGKSLGAHYVDVSRVAPAGD
jgi:hypothetical protein